MGAGLCCVSERNMQGNHLFHCTRTYFLCVSSLPVPRPKSWTIHQCLATTLDLEGGGPSQHSNWHEPFHSQVPTPVGHLNFDTAGRFAIGRIKYIKKNKKSSEP
jgi:hypothetical protein